MESLSVSNFRLSNRNEVFVQVTLSKDNQNAVVCITDGVNTIFDKLDYELDRVADFIGDIYPIHPKNIRFFVKLGVTSLYSEIKFNYSDTLGIMDAHPVGVDKCDYIQAVRDIC